MAEKTRRRRRLLLLALAVGAAGALYTRYRRTADGLGEDWPVPHDRTERAPEPTPVPAAVAVPPEQAPSGRPVSTSPSNGIPTEAIPVVPAAAGSAPGGAPGTGAAETAPVAQVPVRARPTPAPRPSPAPAPGPGSRSAPQPAAQPDPPGKQQRLAARAPEEQSLFTPDTGHASGVESLEDGSAPGPDFTIKGNADSMLFHPPTSPYYKRTKAEVWFRTADEARAAGFTEWTPKKRASR